MYLNNPTIVASSEQLNETKAVVLKIRFIWSYIKVNMTLLHNYFDDIQIKVKVKVIMNCQYYLIFVRFTNRRLGADES